MERWRKSFVSVDANFELLFERFELMGSLAAFHENDEGELEKAAETSAARNDVLAWMPVGRSSWHSSTAQILLQELESGAHGGELLDRKSDVEGKSVTVGGYLGVRRSYKKK